MSIRQLGVSLLLLMPVFVSQVHAHRTHKRYDAPRGAIVHLGEVTWTFDPAVNTNGIIATCSHGNESTTLRQDFGGRVGRVIDLVACARDYNRQGLIAIGLVTQDDKHGPVQYRLGWLRVLHRTKPDYWLVSRVLESVPANEMPFSPSLIMPGGDSVAMALTRLQRGDQDEIEVRTIVNHCPLGNAMSYELADIGVYRDRHTWQVTENPVRADGRQSQPLTPDADPGDDGDHP